MNNAEYVQLRLFRNDMNHIEPDSRYTNSFITISTFQENVSKLQKVIDFLHQDLVWDGIPTI